jgi:signal transduction histidine kinase
MMVDRSNGGTPSQPLLTESDFRTLFESAPGLYLVLLPDPAFTIVAVSDAYLSATMTKRFEILGRGIFDVFPDNPADPNATGERNLRASLDRVVHRRHTDAMAVQKYDIRKPEAEGGEFEERFWSPVNSPVFDAQSRLAFIIHRVEDVTEFIRLKQQQIAQGKLTDTLRQQTESMEAEIFVRAQELDEANRQLREANQQLEASWTSLSKEKADALIALRQSQEQLLQSQKLEAIGRLAGGVAHDFNNLLTVIGGYCDLVLKDHPLDDAIKLKIQEVRTAADRASALTRQLLAFSRKQVLQPRILNLNETVTELSKMLHRMIGEDIQLRTSLKDGLGNVKADPGQMEQVLMNLVVNARDAMPSGGTISIETADVYLDESYARTHVSATPGHYVMLAVSDTGCGMDPETQQHAFEPFFTTKGLGKGTGLGLSTAYGIVKQSGGNIWLYSELDKGTTFKVYLPRVTEEAEQYKQMVPSPDLLGGTETILLVEDAEMVRNLARQILEDNGYQVLEAGSAREALQLAAENYKEINLLLTDVVMPEMSGHELATRLLNVVPQLRVLYMSGYTEDTIVNHGVLEEGINFMPKPFGPDALLTRVREVLSQLP